MLFLSFGVFLWLFWLWNGVLIWWVIMWISLVVWSWVRWCVVGLICCMKIFCYVDELRVNMYCCSSIICAFFSGILWRCFWVIGIRFMMWILWLFLMGVSVLRSLMIMVWMIIFFFLRFGIDGLMVLNSLIVVWWWLFWLILKRWFDFMCVLWKWLLVVVKRLFIVIVRILVLLMMVKEGWSGLCGYIMIGIIIWWMGLNWFL